MIRILRSADFQTTRWSGGTTTQLFIFPEGSSVSEQNFELRISTATVETPHAVFTPFTGYRRILSILEGQLEIAHQASGKRTLVPGMVHSFSGDCPTTSEGTVRDFNVIYKPGQSVTVESLQGLSGRHTFEADGTLFLFVYSGSCRIETHHLEETHLCISDAPVQAEFAENSSVMLIRTDVSTMHPAASSLL